jgi:uncharacterized alpha-E superfamily protein
VRREIVNRLQFFQENQGMITWVHGANYENKARLVLVRRKLLSDSFHWGNDKTRQMKLASVKVAVENRQKYRHWRNSKVIIIIVMDSYMLLSLVGAKETL